MNTDNPLVSDKRKREARSWLQRTNAFLQLFDNDISAPCSERINYLEGRVKQLESQQSLIAHATEAHRVSSVAGERFDV